MMKNEESAKTMAINGSIYKESEKSRFLNCPCDVYYFLFASKCLQA
jgi:hypothetical protein